MPNMRFRIYKRKVVLLTLVVVVCGFAVWSNGNKQRKVSVFSKDSEQVRRSSSSSSSSSNSNNIDQPPLQGHPAAQAPAQLQPQPPAQPQAPVQAQAQAPAPVQTIVPASRRPANDTPVEQSVKPETDNATMVYRSIVFQLNFDQVIRNEAKFRTVRQKDDLVVVVQVHNRPEYLRLLVESLRKARGVENILLIFSHDYWSPEINQVVASVDFCSVLQIFFPFSIQLYPQEFPGNDPKDCPRDIPKKEALKLGCINAEYPDSFGHYREAKFSQTKHHWWWKLHFVWDRVRALKDHQGLVLFIEEDHYLAPDFHHVLKMMGGLKREQCPDCNVLSLGSYSHIGYSSKANRVEVKAWRSTEHNMGMAFTRQTYQQLIQCTEAFCTYDDYNWDWSLQHLTVTCLPSFWKVMVCEAPRIFHAGDCGMHHKKSTCMPAGQRTKIENVLQSSGNQLFPKNLLIAKRLPANGAGGVAPHVKNGGWGDIRDHELCKSYLRLQ